MSTTSEAERILDEFGVKLSEDLAKSLNKALKDAGNTNPMPPRLTFGPKIKISGPSVTLNIVASDDYWRYIESGRKRGARKVPADAVGKKWQNKNAIDARKVLLQMRIKSSKKQLNYSKSKLNYDKAARSLSFVIQNSIFKKGIKPKPFIDRVIDDGRIEELSLKLRQVLGPAYKLEIISELT